MIKSTQQIQMKNVDSDSNISLDEGDFDENNVGNG